MSDLISRQAAIDSIRELCEHYTPTKRTHHPHVDFIIEEIESLPSVQPEQRCDEWCTDCKEYDHEKNCCPRFNRVIREMLKDVQSYRQKGNWEIYVISMLDGEGCKCSECGCEGMPQWRYCPNCGADMGEVERND